MDVVFFSLSFNFLFLLPGAPHMRHRSRKRLTAKQGRPADAAQGYGGGGRVKETLDAKAKWTRPDLSTPTAYVRGQSHSSV